MNETTPTSWYSPVPVYEEIDPKADVGSCLKKHAINAMESSIAVFRAIGNDKAYAVDINRKQIKQSSEYKFCLLVRTILAIIKLVASIFFIIPWAIRRSSLKQEFSQKAELESSPLPPAPQSSPLPQLPPKPLPESPHVEQDEKEYEEVESKVTMEGAIYKCQVGPISLEASKRDESIKRLAKQIASHIEKNRGYAQYSISLVLSNMDKDSTQMSWTLSIKRKGGEGQIEHPIEKGKCSKSLCKTPFEHTYYHETDLKKGYEACPVLGASLQKIGMLAVYAGLHSTYKPRLHAQDRLLLVCIDPKLDPNYSQYKHLFSLYDDGEKDFTKLEKVANAIHITIDKFSELEIPKQNYIFGWHVGKGLGTQPWFHMRICSVMDERNLRSIDVLIKNGLEKTKEGTGQHITA